MRCRDVERFVTAFVDGDLDDARASALRGHARTCASCAAIVEAEASVRDAAADLDPAVDPPPSLWDGIEARIAEAEVADSERSWLWLWWQGARRQVAMGVAAAGVVAVALVWMSRDREPAPAVSEPAPVHTAPAPVQITMAEQLSDELARADERYQTAIRELLEIAAEERAEWTAETARAFDARLAELEQAVLRERAAAAGDRSPQSHDALFAAYQVQISFLNAEVLR